MTAYALNALVQYVLDAGGSSLEESVYSSTFNMSFRSQVESFHNILSVSEFLSYI